MGGTNFGLKYGRLHKWKQQHKKKPIVMNLETLDLKQLRYFVEIAGTLSFTRAAENLGVPKSVVSKGVSKLEQDLGLKILERTSRVVRLTEAGNILYSRAIPLLSDARHLMNDVQNLQKSVSGHLRLAAAPSLGRYISSNIIPLFMQQWPDVKVSLVLSYTYEDLFKEGLDLAFRMGKNKDLDLIEKPLGQSNRVVVASPQYVSEHKKIEHPHDLEDHNTLQVFAKEVSVWTLKKEETVVPINVNYVFQCSDISALKSTLLKGVGIAKLPWFAVRDEVASGQLERILPKWTSTGLPIMVVYRDGLNKSPKLAAFLSLLYAHQDLFDLAITDS
ncbi:MAG: DNA-binding transcriptional LysR family regulator [Flavobacteriales bacterium]